MTTTTPPADTIAGRWTYRKTCVLAGGLAIAGGGLALAVNPWFAALAAVAGVWLILAPGSDGCSG